MECAEDATKNSRARVRATAKPLCKANNSAPQREWVRLARTFGRGCIFPLIRVWFRSARCGVMGVCSVVGTCGPQASEPQRRQASYRRKPVSQRPMFRLFAVRKAACRQIRRRVNFRSVVRSYLVQGVSPICIPPAGLPQRRFWYTLAHKSWLTVLSTTRAHGILFNATPCLMPSFCRSSRQ